MKKEHPKAAVVSYVNTSALVKSESDICCTSMNAVNVVNSLDENEVVFVPDVNLGRYVQTKTDKKIILWPGHCYVHSTVLSENIREAKKEHPKVIANIFFRQNLSEIIPKKIENIICNNIQIIIIASIFTSSLLKFNKKNIL